MSDTMNRLAADLAQIAAQLKPALDKLANEVQTASAGSAAGWPAIKGIASTVSPHVAEVDRLRGELNEVMNTIKQQVYRENDAAFMPTLNSRDRVLFAIYRLAEGEVDRYVTRREVAKMVGLDEGNLTLSIGPIDGHLVQQDMNGLALSAEGLIVAKSIAGE